MRPMRLASNNSSMSKVEQMAMFGMVLLALAFILLILTSCAPVSASSLCDSISRGSLLQTSEDPVTFDVVVDRQVVLRGVTAEQILNECKEAKMEWAVIAAIFVILCIITIPQPRD